MSKLHWMVKLVRIVAVLFVLFGCFVVFLYTPFYSSFMVKALNAFVPVEVNQLAAKSQQMAALTDEENLEPGSDLWIARQAYLKVMEEALRSSDPQDLGLIQARYKVLQDNIKKEQSEDDEDDKPQIPLMRPEQPASEVQPSHEASQALEIHEVFSMNSDDDKVLMEQYIHFLKTHEIEHHAEHPHDEKQLDQDIAYIHNQNEDKKKSTSQPYAIVVLGGGLTLDKNQKDIVVNEYTRLRLEKTLDVEQKTKLPIVLSGVEAPFMQTWLNQHHVEAKLLENRSMNTCENTRFSSLLLQKKGGAPTVLLITDRYHMPRTRRLFALNGIETIPVEAPMPTQLTAWKPSIQNYDHSRRANYEMLATIRDMLFGSSGCREVP
ncbi:YdcF family protein [Acinetobacter sp. ANC 3832]|uniref:YdcF family protein n=1 Tax=Acinetobacter sp. ANC 3832 TaxID=1977874 RepID=UPI000A34FE86|nr:YdcF family protein [Acinetobacter sp. ANC 3832]OTG93321.1 hypothetical protein B9T35_09945 [Acinetobacter sp. ANC 3832]